MSCRSWSSEALILSVKDFGEGHRNAVLLLPGEEHCSRILEAAVFGGPKSKMRGLVVPYQSGTVWLYSNPIKNSNKITDFKVTEYRIGLRDNLTRLWCAAFASELAVKLKGNIDWEILNFFLTGISYSNEAECRTALLRFLWRVIIFSGIAPEVETCNRCGLHLSGKIENLSFVKNNENEEVLFYIPNEDACVCKNCLQKGEPNFKLSSESLLYLFAVKNLIPKISRTLNISEKTYSELKHFLFYLIKSQTEGTFRTLESGDFLF